MSKQAKLAAFMREAELYFSNNIQGNLERCRQRYLEFFRCPDDPPQPPEMPECVRALLGAIETFGVICKTSNYVKAVRDHYAQPLKLELGKVYVDASGQEVQVVWKSPSLNGYRWLGVVVSCGEVRWFNDDGKPPCQSPEFKLIREVTK